MTTFLLIRHAAHDLLGKALAGRTPGVHLNAAGSAQADRLAQRLFALPLRAVYTSPLERTVETATPIAARCGLEMRVDAALNEIDFGAWCGATFRELEGDPAWQAWNHERSRARPPGGETMAEVAQRAAARMAEWEAYHGDEHVALVTHCDVIRAVLLHFLGMSFDSFARLEISPASVSVLILDGGQSQLHLLNDTT